MKNAGSLFALAFIGSAYGGACGGDSASFHVMPSTLGREHEIFKTPITLPCDSMVVPAGRTTVIHASSMLHFGPHPSHASKICVKGTLKVLGEPEHPVYFSASVQQTQVGSVPGNQVWDGIEVDSGAIVDFRYARIFNAPTAMILFSSNVRMIQTYFQGSSGLILPDTSIFLNTQGATLDTLDLRKKKSASSNASAGMSGDKGSHASGSGISGKKIAWYSAAGVGIAAVSGIAWYALRAGPASSTPPTNSGLDPNPTFPDKPNPQK